MSSRCPIVRRIARELIAHAAKVMPARHSDWAKALTNEAEHIQDDFSALGCAIGCALASYNERMRLMQTGSLRISRWVLSLEMLLCFIPLTLLGFAVLSVSATGNMLIGDALVYLSATAIGPVGLVVAFRSIVLRRTELGTGTRSVLYIAAGWTVLAFFLLALGGSGPIGEWWREMVLIAALPAIGAAPPICRSWRSMLASRARRADGCMARDQHRYSAAASERAVLSSGSYASRSPG